MADRLLIQGLEGQNFVYRVGGDTVLRCFMLQDDGQPQDFSSGKFFLYFYPNQSRANTPIVVEVTDNLDATQGYGEYTIKNGEGLFTLNETYSIFGQTVDSLSGVIATDYLIGSGDPSQLVTPQGSIIEAQVENGVVGSGFIHKQYEEIGAGDLGSLSGGSLHAVSDVVTFANVFGAGTNASDLTITVDAVDGGGAITAFTVNTPMIGALSGPTSVLTKDSYVSTIPSNVIQTSTTGVGISSSFAVSQGTHRPDLSEIIAAGSDYASPPVSTIINAGSPVDSRYLYTLNPIASAFSNVQSVLEVR